MSLFEGIYGEVAVVEFVARLVLPVATSSLLVGGAAHANASNRHTINRIVFFIETHSFC